MLALADLGTGVEHWFARLGRLQARAAHDRRVTIGSSPSCDITLAGESVSDEACVVELSSGIAFVRTRVAVPGAVTVNGLPLRPGGHLELVQGAVLRIGDGALVALGHPVAPAPAIAARTLDEFILASLHVHGSIRAAAAALGIARSTFHDRVKKALERRSI